MSATFATPVAAVLLAVELLLFEWKPRSVTPRRQSPVPAPPLCVNIFLVWDHSSRCLLLHSSSVQRRYLGCAVAGLLAGALSALLTVAVYASEDAFKHLPIHWMWWPAIGGLVIGIGGFVFPQALGVGYDTIDVPAARECLHLSYPGHFDCFRIYHLVLLAWLWHLWRCAGPAPDDGWCVGWVRGILSAACEPGLLAADSVWPPSWAAPCVPPLPA